MEDNINTVQTGSNRIDSYEAEIPVEKPETELSKLTENFSKQVLDKYDILAKLGQGTQGSVFKAVRKSDGQITAIKQLPIGSVTTWKEYELFQREVAVLGSLSLQGVAKFYEAIECLEDPHPAAYIVQEFIPGRTLDVMMKSGYRFSLTKSFQMILQLIDILDKLHHHDPPVIHRDIKPSNIILKPAVGDDFDLYLIDFGAVANPQLKSGGSTVAGTYGYMPPEQLMGHPTPESDIYALGALCVNFLTGIAPADLPVKDFHLIFEPEMQNMPVSVVNTIRAMLEPNAENRLCSYEKLRTIFDRFYHSDFNLEGTNSFLTEEILPFNERMQKYDGFLSRCSAFPKELQKSIQYTKSDMAYKRQLRAVNTLCQPGNLELWQRLPEHTPRYTAPYILNKSLFGTKAMKYRTDYIEKDDMFAYFKLKGASKQVFGVGTLIICIAVLVLAYIGGAEFDGLGFLALFEIPFILLALGMMNMITTETNQMRTGEKMFIEWAGKNKPVRDMRQNIIENLILHGRKTIATIVSVEFVETTPANVEALLTPEGEIRQLANAGAASFTIRYKFNPPDDSNPDDLIHKVIIHSMPPKNMKPGEPLPILYSIQKMGAERVYSMPFPFPVDDVCEQYDLIDFTNNDRIMAGTKRRKK